MDLVAEPYSAPTGDLSIHLIQEPIADFPPEQFLYKFDDSLLRNFYNQVLSTTSDFDCLFINQSGVITEGTRSNFYIELDGRLITSPVSAGLLPGTYRDLLIQEGCLVQSITLEMFKKSNRIFISNALIGKRLAVIGENSNGFAGIRNHLL